VPKILDAVASFTFVSRNSAHEICQPFLIHHCTLLNCCCCCDSQSSWIFNDNLFWHCFVRICMLYLWIILWLSWVLKWWLWI